MYICNSLVYNNLKRTVYDIYGDVTHVIKQINFPLEFSLNIIYDDNWLLYMQDYEKAFDRVPRGKLWNIMKNKGFPDNVVKTVQTRIKIDKGRSIG
jgi:hypothetical protein